MSIRADERLARDGRERMNRRKPTMRDAQDDFGLREPQPSSESKTGAPKAPSNSDRASGPPKAGVAGKI